MPPKSENQPYHQKVKTSDSFKVCGGASLALTPQTNKPRVKLWWLLEGFSKEGRGAVGVIRVGEGVAHRARRIDWRGTCIPDRNYKVKLKI
jgi:hypothetical protein